MTREVYYKLHRKLLLTLTVFNIAMFLLTSLMLRIRVWIVFVLFLIFQPDINFGDQVRQMSKKTSLVVQIIVMVLRATTSVAMSP